MGVMTLIVVLSVMNGFERDLKRALQGANGHLILQSYSGMPWGEEKEFYRPLREHPGIEAYAPFATSQALLMGPGKPQGALIKGIDRKKEPLASQLIHFLRLESFLVRRDNRVQGQANENQQVLAQKILQGLPPHEVASRDDQGKIRPQRLAGIILGSQLARNLDVDIGGFVTLVSPAERMTPFGPMPRAKKFVVVGLFESGLMGYDEVLALVDLSVVQALEKSPGKIGGLTIRVKPGADPDEVQKDLQEAYPFPFHVTSWKEQNKNLFAMFRLEKIGLAVVLTLIILIAAFNIISSLVILVKEKRRDIAILKAMGATRQSIQTLFFYQGAVIGLTGTVIGEILGTSICWVLSHFEVIEVPAGVYVGNRIPVHMEFWQLSLIGVVSLVICFSVTLWPAKGAADLDPVETLRYE